jgi:hypothetical protein
MSHSDKVVKHFVRLLQTLHVSLLLCAGRQGDMLLQACAQASVSVVDGMSKTVCHICMRCAYGWMSVPLVYVYVLVCFRVYSTHATFFLWSKHMMVLSASYLVRFLVAACAH